MAVRSNLRWLLAGSTVLSAWALWWPNPANQPVSDRVGAQAAPAPAQRVLESTPFAPEASASLPEQLPITTFDAARFDPFVGAQAPPPPSPKQVHVAEAPVVAPPPQPVAPALNYRYLGRMTDPSGTQRVYLAKNDAAIVVAIGTQLDEGYVVEAFEPAGVRLHYPPLDARAVIPVPASQDSSLQ